VAWPEQLRRPDVNYFIERLAGGWEYFPGRTSSLSMPSQKLEVRALRSNRWGVILAGGDGKRLLPLTRKISGDDRPKQFCALTGGETLLDQTRRRVGLMIPKEQTLLLLTRTHGSFYSGQVAGIPSSCLLEQPFNRGTAPAIVYSLARLHDLDSNGIVAFFPSDHHFGDNDAFAAHIELAFTQAEADRKRVILLGITPDSPEESYGWIEPGTALADEVPVFKVRRFWEKPSRRIASRLMSHGCLWNSFVMVGRISAFLSMVRRTLPALLGTFESMMATMPQGGADEALRRIYDSISATNFSDDVLAVSSKALAVLRADALAWSDLGEPQRVFSIDRVTLENEWLGLPA
jgi:mannose-1-phosphate guanylyltransferase